jgi:hypothetical protein
MLPKMVSPHSAPTPRVLAGLRACAEMTDRPNSTKILERQQKENGFSATHRA